MRYFQFKILHRIIPCNSFLKTVKIIDDENCHLCLERETIEHMLWLCPIINSFWTNVALWINDTLKTKIKIDCNDVFLGLLNHSKYVVINYVLYCSKYYLFQNRSNKSKPDIEILKGIIDSKIKDEKNYFYKINQVSNFENKWKGFI